MSHEQLSFVLLFLLLITTIIAPFVQIIRTLSLVDVVDIDNRFLKHICRTLFAKGANQTVNSFILILF